MMEADSERLAAYLVATFEAKNASICAGTRTR